MVWGLRGLQGVQGSVHISNDSDTRLSLYSLTGLSFGSPPAQQMAPQVVSDSEDAVNKALIFWVGEREGLGSPLGHSQNVFHRQFCHNRALLQVVARTTVSPLAFGKRPPIPGWVGAGRVSRAERWRHDGHPHCQRPGGSTAWAGRSQ